MKLAEELQHAALGKGHLDVDSGALDRNLLIDPLGRNAEVVDLPRDVLDLQRQLLARLALQERPFEVEITRVQSARFVVAGVSLVYDLGAGLLILAATDSMASWFGVPLPNPVLFAKLNGLFLIAVGLGYLQPLRRPEAHRAYLWIFGVLLKGAGAIVFILDHVVHASPLSFLLFAVSDGFLAVWTLEEPPVRRRVPRWKRPRRPAVTPSRSSG